MIFPVDEFLFELFPSKNNNLDELKDLLTKYYTVGPYLPQIEISKNTVKIVIDEDLIEEDKVYSQTLVDYSEQGNFKQVSPLAKELIKKSANVSEYHTILGQILTKEGDNEEAMNHKIKNTEIWDGFTYLL